MFAKKKFKEEDVLIKHPSPIIVSGPSGAGKTQLTRDIIENYDKTTTIRKEKIKVMWAYKMVESLKPFKNPKIEVSFFEGVPTMNQIRNEKPDILVLDDLILQVAKNDNITEIFLMGSHHRNVTVFLLAQNIFAQGNAMRSISLQARYLIFMKSMRDQAQFKKMATQIAIPYQRLIRDYQKFTERPFGYICIDLSQETPLDIRLRTNITPRLMKGFNSPIVAPDIEV